MKDTDMKLILAAAVLITALGTAAPAAADANDEQFLDTLTLHEMGCTQVSFLDCGPSGEQSLIELGKEICTDMQRAHWNETTAIATMMRVAAKEGPDKFPFTKSMATVFVRAAETAYCPQLKSDTVDD
jgi:hypothetical protein